MISHCSKVDESFVDFFVSPTQDKDEDMLEQVFGTIIGQKLTDNDKDAPLKQINEENEDDNEEHRND